MAFDPVILQALPPQTPPRSLEARRNAQTCGCDVEQDPTKARYKQTQRFTRLRVNRPVNYSRCVDFEGVQESVVSNINTRFRQYLYRILNLYRINIVEMLNKYNVFI